LFSSPPAPKPTDRPSFRIPGFGWFPPSIRQALPVVFLVAFFGWLFGALLSSHMLMPKGDGWYSGGSTWGDLAWHLSMLSNFAERGLGAVREDPIYPGTKLSYPFLPDLLSAELVRCGLSIRASLILPTLPVILGAVVAIYSLARRITGTIWGALAVPFIYFFNGSIAGCYFLWRDYRNSHLSLAAFLNHIPQDYAHIREYNIRFSNIIDDYVLPQRASVFGLLLGVLVVQFLWCYWEHSDKKYLLYAGVVLSAMPLVHFHSFVALGMAAGFLFVIQLLAEPNSRKQIILNWAVFAIPMAVFSLPQTLWIAPAHAGNFFRIEWGWIKGNEPLWLFWLMDLSPHLPVFVIAFWFAKRRLKTFYLGFVGVFLVANIVVFQPHDWDNMKLMLWWFLLSSVLAGSLLADLWRESRLGPLLAVALFGTLVITGATSVYREFHMSALMFSWEDMALAHFVREQTSKDAIFLTSDRHTSPVACLGGRRIVMGCRCWLWTHGIDYHTREQDILEIYRGSDHALDLLRRYHVDYILIEADKMSELHENLAFFMRSFHPVYNSQNYLVFKVSP
jgi:hypothetical protein